MLLLRGALANLPTVLEEMAIVDSLTVRSNGLAAPFFYSTLLGVDGVAREVGRDDVGVIFDQTSEYEPMFRDAF